MTEKKRTPQKRAPRKKTPPIPEISQKSLSEWLKEMPHEDDIKFKEGVPYIPIEACERLLDEMCSKYDLTWNTDGYQSKFFMIGNEMFISATIKLTLYSISFSDQYNKSVVGTATFPIRAYLPNTHFDSIAKSLCTVNAASDLGNKFGRLLSKDEVPVIQASNCLDAVPTRKGKKGVKIEPDENIRKKMLDATMTNDTDVINKLNEMYDFSI